MATKDIRGISDEKDNTNIKTPVQQESYHIYPDVLSDLQYIDPGRAGHTKRRLSRPK